ncbi:MAG: hypothetical protein FD143_2654 [Ignavibacteria bacterium]|nr:MAG: hypothetical protein FD143_2654 [Ignavibacteria bacterium]KAF0156122.1 MAG: hypothetical protein FD188_3013 [Ignavibacteria bacterium]
MKPASLLRTTFLLVAVLLTFSCEEGAVTQDDSNAIPGRRDYAWVIDTINNPFLRFTNIWGNDSKNVWIAGAMMSDGLYKYDGSKWSLDNRVYISDPSTVWGYENDLWVGNDNGCIWKFTGSSYIQELNDFEVNGNLVSFYAMTGSSSTEIFAVGENFINPVLMKYSGMKWFIDKVLPDLGNFIQLKYSTKSDRYYIVQWLTDYSIKILEYNRKELKEIYEYPPSNGGPTISIIDGYLYLVIEKKIFRYFNSKMEFIFEVNDPNFGGVVWGRNRNDVLIRMLDGIAHYNGTDWKYLLKSSEPIMLAPNCALFSKEVFIPAKIRRTGYPIIYHGKLE